MKRVFTGVFIPAHIWTSNLSPAEKMLLGEISALSIETGWCYASRSHFAEWLHCDVTNVTYYLKKLEKAGYIDVKRTPGYESKIRVKTDAFFVGTQAALDTGVVNPVHGGSESSSRGVVNPVHGGSESSSPVNTRKSKEEKEVKGNAPQAGANPSTHQQPQNQNGATSVGEIGTLEADFSNAHPVPPPPPSVKQKRQPKTENGTDEILAHLKGEVVDFFHAIHADWQRWTAYKRRDKKGVYKSAETEAVAITRLFGISSGQPGHAREAIEHSIGNNYAGIYAPKPSDKQAEPVARYSLADRPQCAHTPDGLIEEIREFYKANTGMLAAAQGYAGTAYGPKDLAGIVQHFCANQVQRSRCGDTFEQQHAALTSWLITQKSFDKRPEVQVSQSPFANRPDGPQMRSTAVIHK